MSIKLSTYSLHACIKKIQNKKSNLCDASVVVVFKRKKQWVDDGSKKGQIRRLVGKMIIKQFLLQQKSTLIVVIRFSFSKWKRVFFWISLLIDFMSRTLHILIDFQYFNFRSIYMFFNGFMAKLMTLPLDIFGIEEGDWHDVYLNQRKKKCESFS